MISNNKLFKMKNILKINKQNILKIIIIQVNKQFSWSNNLKIFKQKILIMISINKQFKKSN